MSDKEIEIIGDPLVSTPSVYLGPLMGGPCVHGHFLKLT